MEIEYNKRNINRFSLRRLPFFVKLVYIFVNMPQETITVPQARQMLKDFFGKTGKKGKPQHTASRDTALSINTLLQNPCCADCANLNLTRQRGSEVVLPSLNCKVGEQPVTTVGNMRQNSLIVLFECVKFVDKNKPPEEQPDREEVFK